MATITKRGNKYRVQVRRDGSYISETLTTRKDAEAWARKKEIELDQGDLPSDPRKQLKGMQLCELVSKYRDEVSPRKKSARDEIIVLNAFLRHPICRKAIADIKVKDFAEYRDQGLQEVSPVTLKRQLAIIQNIYEIGKKDFGFPIKTNPVADLNFSAKVVRRDRRLENNELELILEDARQRKNPYIEPIILFALETSMRLSEIVAMQWSHIDLKTRLLLIPETKNGHSRKIPLSRKAVEVLEGIDPETEQVFPVTANCLKLTWKRILQRVGIEDLHFHDLRHEGISSLFDKGLHINEVRQISGHRTLSQLSTYTHARPENILAKLDRHEASNVSAR